jgi:hypothetical protein
MNNKQQFLVEEFSKIKPEIKDDGFTLIIELDEIIRAPDDWTEFCMLITGLNYPGSVHGDELSFVTLEDIPMEKAFSIIKHDSVKLIVLGHPKGDNVIWELCALNNNGNKMYVGGEHFRLFCDDKNIYYRSLFDKDNVLMSGSDLKFTKNDDDDCRKPLRNVSGTHEIH